MGSLIRTLPFTALLLGLWILPMSGCTEEVEEPSEIGESSEILWDTWGVPHIYATNSRELFYAFGWSQMQAHGDVILRLYGEARGRSAEYWGSEGVNSDRWIRTVGIPVRAEEWLQAQRQPIRGFLEAFAQGINDYAMDNPEQISEEVRSVLPVTPADPLAHAQRVLIFEFVTRQSRIDALAEQLESSPAGSNAWAIGPARSESGNAMLLANPHLPWSSFYLWHETHLVSPEVNIYGATLVGLPMVAIGFNQNLGWTHTVNTFDGEDLYELRLQDDGYVWDGSVRPFERTEEVFRVRMDDGSMREENLTVKRSVHGPVVREKGKRALSLRVVGLYETGLVEQYWDMARASNLQEFEASVSRLQMPMFTVMYADREGHTLSLFGGQTPIRPSGDWDWSRIVPGDTSKTLWTSTHSYDDLPRVVDPDTGWLQNANDPPWTTTLPYVLNPDDFPPYMAPHFMHFRAQISARMLQEDNSISFQEMVEKKHSTRMELADRILDDLIDSARSSGKGGELVSILERWDLSASADSRGSVLFSAFYEEYLKLVQHSGLGGPFAQEWREEEALAGPRGLSQPDLAVKALQQAASGLVQTYGRADVAWGEVFRLRRGEVDLPASGGPGGLGLFRVVYPGPSSGDGKTYSIVGGDSFVAAVEFSDPVRAMVVNATGSSSKPGSPHFADQLDLVSRNQLRPAWLSRREVEANLAGNKAIGPLQP